MKKIITFFSILLVAFCSDQLYGQCANSTLSDDYSTPALWPVVGTPTTGTIAVTGGVVEWDGLQSRQTQRIIRDVNSALPNSNLWRIEWDFECNTTGTEIGALLMGVTSDTTPSRFAVPGVNTETDQNTVEVLVGNPSNSTTGFYFFVSSKYGTTRTGGPATIPFANGTKYYLRLQRTSPGQCVLSVFDTPDRTSEITGSPLCFTIDSRIDGLRYLQQGGWTSSGAGREMTAEADNLCIFDTNKGEDCGPDTCSITPNIDVDLDVYTCDITFTDNTTYGPGTTPVGNFVIEFGDGTTGQLPPGGSVTHHYNPAPSAYAWCVHIFAYDGDYGCCNQTICGNKLVNCDPPLRIKNPDLVKPVRGVRLYPNPGNQMVNVRSDKAIRSLRIYDSSGSVILDQAHLDQNAVELNLEDLSNGIYFFEINLGDEVITEKFSKIQ